MNKYYINTVKKLWVANLGDGELGSTLGTILKKGYAFSHYSRYVYPEFQRVGVSVLTVAKPLRIAAYKGDNSIVTAILSTLQVLFFGLTLPISGTTISVKAITTNEFVNISNVKSPNNLKGTCSYQYRPRVLLRSWFNL